MAMIKKTHSEWEQFIVFTYIDVHLFFYKQLASNGKFLSNFEKSALFR